MSIGRKVLIGLDQTLNCCVKLSDGWGYPDETLSARAWRMRYRHPRLWRMIDRLFGADHCRLSYESEIARLHYPKDYRGRP